MDFSLFGCWQLLPLGLIASEWVEAGASSRDSLWKKVKHNIYQQVRKTLRRGRHRFQLSMFWGEVYGATMRTDSSERNAP